MGLLACRPVGSCPTNGSVHGWLLHALVIVASTYDHHSHSPLIPTGCCSTYTVVGFMGTGRVSFNAALAAVFIEVRWLRLGDLGSGQPAAANSGCLCQHLIGSCSFISKCLQGFM